MRTRERKKWMSDLEREKHGGLDERQELDGRRGENGNKTFSEGSGRGSLSFSRRADGTLASLVRLTVGYLSSRRCEINVSTLTLFARFQLFALRSSSERLSREPSDLYNGKGE